MSQVGAFLSLSGFGDVGSLLGFYSVLPQCWIHKIRAFNIWSLWAEVALCWFLLSLNPFGGWVLGL